MTKQTVQGILADEQAQRGLLLLRMQDWDRVVALLWSVNTLPASIGRMLYSPGPEAEVFFARYVQSMGDRPEAPEMGRGIAALSQFLDGQATFDEFVVAAGLGTEN